MAPSGSIPESILFSLMAVSHLVSCNLFSGEAGSWHAGNQPLVDALTLGFKSEELLSFVPRCSFQPLKERFASDGSAIATLSWYSAVVKFSGLPAPLGAQPLLCTTFPSQPRLRSFSLQPMDGIKAAGSTARGDGGD